MIVHEVFPAKTGKQVAPAPGNAPPLKRKGAAIPVSIRPTAVTSPVLVNVNACSAVEPVVTEPKSSLDRR